MDSAPRFGMMPAVKLAVEVTTCTADRAGVGTYTEHLADALIATAAPGDDVVLIGNRAVAPDLAERWAGRLHIAGARQRAMSGCSATPPGCWRRRAPTWRCSPTTWRRWRRPART